MSKSRHVSRREFLQAAGAVAGSVAAAAVVSPSLRAAEPTTGEAAFTLSIYYDPKDAIAASPPAQWAINHLHDLLKIRGVKASVQTDKPGGGDLSIVVSANVSLDPKTQDKPASLKYAAESFALMPSRAGDPNQSIMVSAGDPSGLVFALTELADRVEYAPVGIPGVRAALTLPSSITESPANPYRGTFRMFSSETEDKRWFYDREGWQKYFDMLVTHRFNHFNLSFGLSYDMSTNLTDTYTFFLYPFMVDVPGYKVRATAKGGAPLPADEQKKNLDTLKFISDQAALRGLKFTLGIWTHSFRWTNSPNATFTIDGLDAQSMPLYSRDAMKMLIDACPSITGITLRTHGESGVPEGNYDFWKVIMAGLTGHKNADGTDRQLELDLHAKSLTPQLIDIALATGMPVILSCKLWAEHMGLPYMQASIREAELPKDRDQAGLMGMSNGTRSLLRYGVGDLLTKDRKYKMIHRVWPGSQKLLLWGDPLYAAEYGRTGYFAGMDGIDFFEPLSFRGRAGSSLGLPAAPDRSGYSDDTLRTKYDWEKYAYTFRLWGRLSYNPDAKPETWQRQLNSDFDIGDAPIFENALANSSRILPLITTAHDPAAAGDQYWPEMYTNQSLYNPANSPYSEAPAPKVFGNISSLDPQIFASVNEYVDSLLSNKPLAKISPLDVARQLDMWSAATRQSLFLDLGADHPRSREKIAAFRRASTDGAIAAGIGQFFAHKFRAAVLWHLFNLSAHEPARAASLEAYKKARDAWAQLADSTKVYLPNLTFGISPNLHGHWSDRLAAIDADIAGLTTAGPRLRNTDDQTATIDRLIQAVVTPVQVDEKRILPRHTPAVTYQPNQPLTLELASVGAPTVRLCYRHIQQGEPYLTIDMQKQANTFTATIPTAYTNSQYPLAYYFELHAATTATLFPGFKENFTGAPYFVVPRA